MMGVFGFHRYVHLCQMPGKQIAVSMVSVLLATRDVMGDRSEQDIFLTGIISRRYAVFRVRVIISPVLELSCVDYECN